MLVSLEGIDGAGKTTLCSKICSAVEYGFCGARYASRKHYQGNSEFIRNVAQNLHGVLWQTGDSKELGADFWLPIQIAWHTLLSDQIATYKASNNLYLMDGWFYKFFARLVVSGHDIGELTSAFQSVLEPDFVLLLEVDVHDVASRRKFRPTEQGLHDGRYNRLSPATFVAYQRETYSVLKTLADNKSNWQVINIKGMPIDASAATLADKLSALGRL